MNIRNVLAASVLTLAASASAHATVTSYTDKSSFAAAAGSTATETFGTATPGLFSSTYSVGFAGFTLSGNTGNNNVGIGTGSFANSGDNDSIPGSFAGQNFLGWGNGNAGNAIGNITITFASPVTAFGFDWFNTDYSDQYGVTLSTGDSFSAPPFTVGSSGTTSGFFGVVSNTALTTATIFNQFGGGYISTEGLDNVVYSSTPVPEPASLGLLAVGMAALSVARRRRA